MNVIHMLRISVLFAIDTTYICRVVLMCMGWGGVEDRPTIYGARCLFLFLLCSIAFVTTARDVYIFGSFFLHTHIDMVSQSMYVCVLFLSCLFGKFVARIDDGGKYSICREVFFAFSKKKTTPNVRTHIKTHKDIQTPKEKKTFNWCLSQLPFHQFYITQYAAKTRNKNSNTNQTKPNLNKTNE